MIDWLTYLLTDWSVWLVSEPSRWSRYFWQFSQTGWFTPTQCNRYSTHSLSVLSYNVLQQNKVIWLGLEWYRLSLAGAATSIIFVVTKHVFCRYKSVFVATKLLLWQTCFCRNKYNFCRDKFTSITTNIFVATKHVFCCDKNMLVMIKVLSRQKFLLQQKYFVATNIIMLWQKCCCSKNAFVASKDVWQLSPMKQTSTVYVWML